MLKYTRGTRVGYFSRDELCSSANIAQSLRTNTVRPYIHVFHVELL